MELIIGTKPISMNIVLWRNGSFVEKKWKSIYYVLFYFEYFQLFLKKRKDDVATFDVLMLAYKMTSLINKSADHKTARTSLNPLHPLIL